MQTVQLAATLRLILISNFFFLKKKGKKAFFIGMVYEHLYWQSFFQAVFENHMFSAFLLLTSPEAGASFPASLAERRKFPHQQIHGGEKWYFSSHLSERSMIVTNNLLLFHDGVSQRTRREYWTAESLIQLPCFLKSKQVRPRVTDLAQGPM